MTIPSIIKYIIAKKKKKIFEQPTNTEKFQNNLMLMCRTCSRNCAIICQKASVNNLGDYMLDCNIWLPDFTFNLFF